MNFYKDFPTENDMILLVTGILGGGWIQCIQEAFQFLKTSLEDHPSLVHKLMWVTSAI